MGDFEKKIPASACQKKKIACSTNVIESLWEKREKNILPTILLEKKFLMTRNHPPPPSRVKWSAPYNTLFLVLMWPFPGYLTTTTRISPLFPFPFSLYFFQDDMVKESPVYSERNTLEQTWQ